MKTRYYEEDERQAGICDSCGKECYAVRVNVGIGWYEYGSARYYDDREAWASPCCGDQVVEGGMTQLPVTRQIAKKEHKGNILWDKRGYCAIYYEQNQTVQQRHLCDTREQAAEQAKILPGDLYMRVVNRHWRKDGPTWYVVIKTRLKKGPAWTTELTISELIPAVFDTTCLVKL